ncbi:MAG TPA: hypothetical protein V6D17_09510 [Candidatus Obscuribacterales bacterium]
MIKLLVSRKVADIAEDLAYEKRMSTSVYLSEVIARLLLAHDRSLRGKGKYVGEMVSQNRKRIGTWRPDKTEK